MELRKLHQPESGIMKVVGMMSGGGSVLMKIIDHERKLKITDGRSPYKVVAIFSDNDDSKAAKIGIQYGIPAKTRDIGNFFARRKKVQTF